MAKESMDVYVPIKPYTVSRQDEQEFNNLRVYVSYRKGRGFIVGYHPGWISKGLGWGCILDFGKNPLTSGADVLAVPASKNSQKIMQAMYELLNEADARTLIAELFNERDYNALTTALRNISTTPGWAKQELASIHAQKEDEKTENTSTSTTKNSTTMANVEINADMVGRVLVMGSGFATYTIQSVSDDKVVCLFHSEGRPDLTIPMKRGDFGTLLTSGNLHWQDEDEQPKQEQPKQEQPKSEPKSEPTTDDDVEEVDAEEVEDEQPKAEPKLRAVTGKIVQEKVREQPIEDDADAEEVEDEPIEDDTEDDTEDEPKAEPKRTKRTTAKGKYFIVPYTTKKGKEAVKIAGFSEDDEIRARGGELHAAKTCERIKGKKYYELMFGPRYSEAARAMCDALNAGTDFDELLEIVETNTEALAQKRAEQKAEYFEKKAEREKKRAEKEAAKAEPKAKATKAAAKGEKLYTAAEVKERIRNAFAALAAATGGDVTDFEPLIEAA